MSALLHARVDSDSEAGEEPADHDISTSALEDEAGGLRRDENFWFDDGSIILHARDVAFKVYARPLIEHSPVFKDMLSFPQQDVYADLGTAGRRLPVVLLHDSPEDLRHVFEVLMPGQTLRPFGFDIHYDLIAAWIRIGQKYEINSLVKCSLRYLRKLYPDNFDDFERYNSSAFGGVKAIGVVNLARFAHAHEILPAALMHCFQIAYRVGTLELAHGFPREDGTMERLSRADLDLCSAAWRSLVDARVELAKRLFTIANIDWDECEHDDPWDLCTDAIEHTLIELELCFLPGLCTPRPLDCLMDEYANSRSLAPLCKSCRAQLVDLSKAERRKIFYRLPSLIGITVDGWGKSKARGGKNVRRK